MLLAQAILTLAPANCSVVVLKNKIKKGKPVLLFKPDCITVVIKEALICLQGLFTQAQALKI